MRTTIKLTEFFQAIDRKFLREGRTPTEGSYSSVWQSHDDTGTLRIGTDDDSLVGCDFISLSG